MDKAEIIDALSHVTYKDWSFFVGEDGERLYLQVTFADVDFATGLSSVQRGRKWLLSPFMTKSEVVTTAFKACITAEEHEAREKFRYKGKMIFGPHINVDALAEVVGKKDNLDMRTGRWVAA